MPARSPREEPRAGKSAESTKIGCLPFLVGAIVGFVVVLLWSRSQIHTMGGGHVIRGESRSILVFGPAMIGALAGGVVVSVVAAIRRKRRDRDPE